MDLHGIKSFEEWDSWKKTIGKAVNLGEAAGLSDEAVEKLGYRIGSLLSASVDPENREQRVLRELWRAGDEGERMALTKMIIKASQVES